MVSYMKLEFGCGDNKHEGYIGCDISKIKGVDVILDLNKKIPFKNNSVDEIRIEHTLEHLEDPIKVITEIYRILKPGGKLIIKVPFAGHSRSFQFDHKHYFKARDFYYFDPSNPRHYFVENFIKFRIEKITYNSGYPKKYFRCGS